MKNVAVFFGGKSIEHDISCITGALTLNALKKGEHIPVPIFIDYDNSWWTGEDFFDIETHKKPNYKKLKRVCLVAGSPTLFWVKGKKLKPLCDIAVGINALHGEFGEDGALSGLLALCEIAIVGSPMLGSSVAINKSISKTVLQGLNVNCLPCITVSNAFTLDSVVNELGFPLIVKPQKGGSSIGIEKANDIAELTRAVNTALRYGEKAVIEPLIENFIEINIGVYKNSKNEIVLSECERPIGKTEVLSFEDKYSGGIKEFPAKIPKKISNEIKRTAKHIYESLELEGVCRMDFMVKLDKVYLNEINTVPGSLSYYLFTNTTKGFSLVLADLIARAEKKFAESSSLQRRFNSSVLDIKGVKGAKRL